MPQKIPDIKIESNKNQYMEKRTPHSRYTSYDYCFNYYQSFLNSDRIKALSSEKNLKLSCLHLGFYLASWGMYRGSGWLLQTSLKIFEPLIKEISKLEERYWKIDVDTYEKRNNIRLLINLSKTIKDSFKKFKEIKEFQGTDLSFLASDTLVTKIMAGIFGSIPAYDNLFNIGLFSKKYCAFTKDSLDFIIKFYQHYRKEIDFFEIHTLDYESSSKITKNIYSKAKIIDMICWIEGFNNESEIKEKQGKDHNITKREILEIKKYIK